MPRWPDDDCDSRFGLVASFAAGRSAGMPKSAIRFTADQRLDRAGMLPARSALMCWAVVRFADP
jgi:hypothetical protein